MKPDLTPYQQEQLDRLREGWTLTYDNAKGRWYMDSPAGRRFGLLGAPMERLLAAGEIRLTDAGTGTFGLPENLQ